MSQNCVLILCKAAFTSEENGLQNQFKVDYILAKIPTFSIPLLGDLYYYLIKKINVYIEQDIEDGEQDLVK